MSRLWLGRASRMRRATWGQAPEGDALPLLQSGYGNAISKALRRNFEQRDGRDGLLGPWIRPIPSLRPTPPNIRTDYANPVGPSRPVGLAAGFMPGALSATFPCRPILIGLSR